MKRCKSVCFKNSAKMLWPFAPSRHTFCVNNENVEAALLLFLEAL